ncbi:MAG: response regulator [Denitrovibrio sp.]|nr:MAG: response regulator [Denitrovibrio sp.]
MKFLIVDDDLVTRHMLSSILQTYGNTAEAVNGTEAIQAFKLAKKENIRYDAIFVDIMMPEMDGQTAVSHIRALERSYGEKPEDEAVIIMLSALDDPKNVIKSYYDSGASSYVVKPVTRDKIEGELRKLKVI